MRPLPVGRCGGTLADDVDRLRLAGLRLALGRAAVEHRRLGPAFVQRLFGGRLDRLRLFSGELDQRAQHAGVGALALAQRAEDRVEDVRDLAQEGARLARRLRGHELEHHRQVVGQLAGREEEAGLLVGLRRGRSSPDRGRASRRARARTGAATWRGRGRTARRRRPRSPADRRAAASRSAHRARPGATARRALRRASRSRISGRWPRIRASG